MDWTVYAIYAGTLTLAALFFGWLKRRREKSFEILRSKLRQTQKALEELEAKIANQEPIP